MVMADEESIMDSGPAIISMRDKGYRNTTYAIAELIDNSVDAGAKKIELLCYDRVVQHDKQERRTIHQIAIADNGRGMNKDELKKAIKIGGSTRFNDRTRIGRFGMGLPVSSISQCKQLDVYTWQNGGRPIHSYISIERVEGGNSMVPQPTPKKIEEHWKTFSECVGEKSGTLVVWSILDRCNWKKSETVIEKSEQMIGRIYRKLIDEQKIKITAIAFRENSQERIERVIRVNDPGYLMENSTTPEHYVRDTKPPKYSNKPMFEQYIEEKETCTVNGHDHDINIRFSVSKWEVREGLNRKDAGKELWGKHAKENVGVSLIRANRELELDTNLVTNETIERWWGVEVAFPPALDEIFGVTFDKQSATNFARLARAIAVGQKNHGEHVDQHLIHVMQKIEKHLDTLRGRIKEQRKGARSDEDDDEDAGAEEIATEADRQQEQDNDVDSNTDEEVSRSEKVESLIKTLMEDGIMDQESAAKKAIYTIDNELKYVIVASRVSGSTLFDVLYSKGVIIVKLNRAHPAYENLIEVLRDVPEECGIEELRERLQRADKGLGLLLLSWARLEEKKTGDDKMQVQDLRGEWGGISKGFLMRNT